MWRKQQAEGLRKEIEGLLRPLSESAGLCDLITEALAKGKRALAAGGEGQRPWPLLPLIVCESVAGRFDKALPEKVKGFITIQRYNTLVQIKFSAFVLFVILNLVLNSFQYRFRISPIKDKTRC